MESEPCPRDCTHWSHSRQSGKTALAKSVIASELSSALRRLWYDSAVRYLKENGISYDLAVLLLQGPQILQYISEVGDLTQITKSILDHCDKLLQLSRP